LTAISQQACYSKFTIDQNLLNSNYLNLNDGTNITELLQLYAKIIVDYFESDIKPKLNHITSYTYDFAICCDKNNMRNQFIPYFIEPNSFGKEYAAGSALFHWILDEDKLYGLTESDNNKINIYLRYVN
jgi:hypothetical protein